MRHTKDLLGLQERFSGVDIRIKVKGGGHVAQVYAIRQAIAKSLVAYYQKCKCIMIEVVSQVYNSWCFRCGWGLQTGDQGYPHQLRSHSVGCRSSSLRSQEVRWSRCPCQIPEIVPINVSFVGCGISLQQLFWKYYRPELQEVVKFISDFNCKIHTRSWKWGCFISKQGTVHFYWDTRTSYNRVKSSRSCLAFLETGSRDWTGIGSACCFNDVQS